MSKQKESAAVQQSKAPISIDPKYIGRLVGTLAGICLVTALLLGIVNQVTKPKIDAIQWAKTSAAMAQVLQAEEYAEAKLDAPNVTAFYFAYDFNGGSEAIPVGYVVETATSGSQGTIYMVVGVDMDGNVTGVSVTKHSETANIGTKVVSDQSVLDRFIGMNHAVGEITVNSGTNRFDGISGATYSSRGVAAGVNAALNAYALRDAAW